MVLCTSALHMDILGDGTTESPESIFHRGAALRYLQRTLETDTEVSDPVIGTVSALAKVEVRACRSMS